MHGGKLMSEPASAVRIITQGEYNSLSPQQQEFYSDLATQGKVKIVEKIPLQNNGKRDTQERKEQSPDPLNRLKGKKVVISLTTQDRQEGTLSEVWKFETVLLTAGGPLVILKHAIVSVREVS